MSINIDITIDISRLEHATTEQMENAQQLLAERVMQNCKSFVPKDTGALRKSASIGESGKTVEWTVDYAQYVYNFEDVSFTTAGTCGHWFERAKQQYLKKWVALVRRAFK